MGISFSNIFGRLWPKREVRLLLLGLDGSGKTRILCKLKSIEVVDTIPTTGTNVEQVEYDNINFTVLDVSGQTRLRPLWEPYFPNTEALIYVVDSSDRDCIEESKHLLHHVLDSDHLRDTVLLVLANKRDKPNALTASQLVDELELDKLSKTRRWTVLASCAKTGDGIYEGLDWISKELNQ